MVTTDRSNAAAAMPTLVTLRLASGWQMGRHVGLLILPYPQHWLLTASFIVVGIMIAIGMLEPVNIAVLFERMKPQADGELTGRASPAR